MALTLSVPFLLAKTLEAYKQKIPMLGALSSDCTDEQSRLNQQVIARISKVPTVQDFNAAQSTNAQDSKSLLEDIPVTLNRHRESVIQWVQGDVEKSQIQLLEAVTNIGYAISKDVTDYILSQALATNFSTSVTQATPDRATLRAITSAMNSNGAGDVRYGIVNSDVYDDLDNDPEITSSDFSGQLQGANPWGTLSNVSGFTNIWEYPDTPANGESMTGVFFDPTAFVLASRPMELNQNLAVSLGVPLQSKVDVVADPTTGMTFTAFTWQDNGSFDLFTKLVVLYGVSAGKATGSAGDKTDFGGCLLKSV
jgi:hypothetical protein